MQLAVCMFVILLLGIEFSIYGVVFCQVFRLKLRVYEIGMVGFFVYFGLFQIAALPLILLQRPFHELIVLWLIIAAAVNVFAFLRGRMELISLFRNGFAGVWRNKGLLLSAVILLALFCCWFQGTQDYVGWDTSYYIGTVNTTVEMDSMYVYNGVSGTIEKALDFRYALSAFYMHSALLCKLTGLGGMLVQKYVIGTICVLMHTWILLALGIQLFPEDEKKSLFMTGLVFVMHLGFHTNYTTSDFLLVRGYEAKGFCANVVIPAVFYAILCIWKDRKRREYWFLAFMVCFSSVPVSMSSLVLVPALMFIAIAAQWLTDRNLQLLLRAFWCVVPNGIYMVLYFIYTKGIRISIK